MTYIGIFGRRNCGKSSIINALTLQDLAIVSDVPGTTTDPVRKTVEIFGIGPVVFVDTAGIDDVGVLGDKRVKKSLDSIAKIDVGILVFSENVWGNEEENILKIFKDNGLPFVIVHNKSDIRLIDNNLQKIIEEKYRTKIFEFSAQNNDKRNDFLELLTKIVPPTQHSDNQLFDNLVKENDIVLLITPCDSEAPTGRMILPQVQAIRSVLDQKAIVIDVLPEQIPASLAMLKRKPVIAVTDSQVFAEVVKILPKDQPLTSFSILLARQKGFFDTTVIGTKYISQLKDGNKILIMESCTHQTSCEDIGRVKLPNVLRKFTGKNLAFKFVSGLSPLPDDLNTFAMAIQCGGCMATARQVNNRLQNCINAGVQVSNYGMALAFCNGIFERATAALML
ncbi:MAG: [FeFe] hydrogenase H-cluster maturation GTPase HydF [Bacteroidales bacterium]|jgi:[FeFe] hydrogenase H-cluster maturation GTPase HydF|nr:[FeFe] hydrogenase H-cluster maturation GTPase HydF [Bacteroidales bacterium]